LNEIVLRPIYLLYFQTGNNKPFWKSWELIEEFIRRKIENLNVLNISFKIGIKKTVSPRLS